MKQKISFIFITGVLFLTCFTAVVQAKENEHGTVDLWIKFQGGEWQKPDSDTHHLKIKEPFQIKAIITAKYEGNVYIRLGQSAGDDKAFETIDGPSDVGTISRPVTLYGWDYNPVPAGWNETFEWTVRTTGEKIGWTVGLNILVEFSPYDEDEELSQIHLGVVNTYIEEEIWDGYTAGDDDDDGNTNINENNNKSTPGFEALILVFALCAVLFIYRKR